MSDSITIVYPHYLATDWMKRSIQTHRQLASSPVSVWVIDMSPNERDYIKVQDSCGTIVDHFVWLRINRKRFYCGEALEVVLPLAGTIVPDGITVLADTDTLMLRQGWDVELRTQLEKHDIAAINSRSAYEPYFETPEWNWMAFKSGKVWSFYEDGGLTDIDWGNYVKRRFRFSTKLWPMLNIPIPRCEFSAVCGDEKGPWAFHAFFATSRLSGDRRGVTLAFTDEEMNAVCKILCPTVFPN